MTLSMTKLVSVMVMAAVAFGLVGCKNKPKTWQGNIEVAPGPNLAGKLTGATLDVDLVGVTEVEASQWSGRDLPGYFAMNSGERADAEARGTAYKMQFGAGKGSGPQVLRKEDPIWQKWKDRKVTKLVVVANSAAGTKMPNHFEMPLTTNRIKVGTIKVQVDSADTTSLTPIEPLKE